MSAEMTQMRCAVHDVRFAAEVPKGDYLHCPFCMNVELGAERALRVKAEEHRNLLLQAIDLKRTLVREGAIQAG